MATPDENSISEALLVSRKVLSLQRSSFAKKKRHRTKACWSHVCEAISTRGESINTWTESWRISCDKEEDSAEIHKRND